MRPPAGLPPWFDSLCQVGGGMGIVYEARDRNLRVAIQTLCKGPIRGCSTC
jgi:hypothetical protein